MTEASNDSSISQDEQRRGELARVTALVQHALNNPLAALAALLAESQLLVMETTLEPDHRAAVVA